MNENAGIGTSGSGLYLINDRSLITPPNPTGRSITISAEMKTHISTLLMVVCIQWAAAAEIPPWHVIKKSARGAKMLKIVEAAYAYQIKNGKFPPTLFSLVSEGFLKERDLYLTNPDKSLTVPDYFPGLSTNMRLDRIVIRAPSEDRSYQIIVRNDLSMEGVPNEEPAEQAVPSDGYKPSCPASSTDPIAPTDAH